VRKLTAVLVPLSLAAFVVAGCGGGSSTTTTSTSAGGGESAKSAATAQAVKVSAKAVANLGAVLVDEEGRTLYVFAPDRGREVTCVSECATVWPPLKVEAGQKASASGQVKPSLLGSDPDPEGGEVVTYAGWPLYTYVADTSPGTATGQAVNLNGGYWYAIAPSGKVVR
jgi:predicted lipoprotein with Yx(FWY)xxD motif